MNQTLAALALASLTALGCNAGAIGGDDTTGGGGGGGDQDGGVTLDDAGNPIDRDSACGVVRSQATLNKSPVDVIFVVDNSGSMQQEIEAVQTNINVNFAKIIKDSGLDYRVIMFSKHGSAATDQSICIDAPLSSLASCANPPAQPGNTATFFQYSTEVASTNSFDLLITNYDSWQSYLRAGAVKTFIEVTDDNQKTSYTAATFDTALRAKSATQWGTAAKRNYIFHSIVGVKEKTVATDAYAPSEAIVATKCTSAVNTGGVYQDLSKLTGGLRFPVCQTGSYDAVFKAVAAGVVSGATLACDFAVPAAPPGKTFLLSKAQLQYTPGNGGAQSYFGQVSDVGQCAPNSFYITNNRVFLCPATCDAVSADTKAGIELLLDCSQVIG